MTSRLLLDVLNLDLASPRLLVVLGLLVVLVVVLSATVHRVMVIDKPIIHNRCHYRCPRLVRVRNSRAARMHFKCALAFAHRWRGRKGRGGRLGLGAMRASQRARRCANTHKQKEVVQLDGTARQAERTTESLCPEKELCGRAKTEIDLTSRLRAPPIPRYSSSPTNTHKASQNRHMHYIRPSPRTPDHPNHSLHTHTHSLSLFSSRTASSSLTMANPNITLLLPNQGTQMTISIHPGISTQLNPRPVIPGFHLFVPCHPVSFHSITPVAHVLTCPVILVSPCGWIPVATSRIKKTNSTMV